MDFRRLFGLSSAWLLTFLLCIKLQVHGCSFGGLTDAGCLDQGENNIPNSCCRALNQAVEAGFNCLCLFVSSFNPLFSNQLLLSLSSCFISVPPLTQCPATLAKLHPPASPAPILPPENLFAPAAQEGIRVPLNSTPTNNSSVVAEPPCQNDAVQPSTNVVDNGDRENKTITLLNPLLLLATTLYACLV